MFVLLIKFSMIITGICAGLPIHLCMMKTAPRVLCSMCLLNYGKPILRLIMLNWLARIWRAWLEIIASILLIGQNARLNSQQRPNILQAQIPLKTNCRWMNSKRSWSLQYLCCRIAAGQHLNTADSKTIPIRKLRKKWRFRSRVLKVLLPDHSNHCVFHWPNFYQCQILKPFRELYFLCSSWLSNKESSAYYAYSQIFTLWDILF